MLIDADALLAYIDVGHLRPPTEICFSELDVKNIVDKSPTIDAVEVVRCKECKYYQDNNGGYPNAECRWNDDETPNADDYCSYGEKMEGKP